MRNQLLALVVVFLAFFQANAQSISVTSPNGGQTLYTGQSFNITWASADVSAFVKLELSADSGNTWSLIADGVNNSGSYSWLIPDNVSENCLIRISDFSDAAVSDTSDAVFTVKHPFITITSPNGGESLEGCSQHTITWTSGGAGNYARIYYSTDGGAKWTSVANPYVGSGSSHSYNWSVPSIASGNFMVRIVDYHDGSISDESDAVFSVIRPADYLTLTSPNGGESWSSSSLKTISWTTEGTAGNVSLKYSINNGASWDWVRNISNQAASNITNTGSYQWLVPAGVSSSSCLVQIYENSKSCNIDISNNLFTIDNNPAITVTAPFGGERWYVGRSYTIRWSASNLPTNYVTIEYTTDNGQNWMEIVASASNNGSYNWTIPNTLSNQCLVRVKARDNAAISDVSENTFTIAKPYITITSPSGGENLSACTSHQITWEQEGLQNYVRIYYSVDGGSNWIHVANPYVGSNTYYNWTVPGLVSDQFAVKVEDYYNNKVADTSALFSVSQAPDFLTLTAPNGGEIWPASSIQTITWNTTGTVGNVSLKYSTNNGASWDWVRNNANSAASNIANTGSYEWLVPSNVVSSNCLIQVYQNSQTCVIDFSDNVFSIDNSPTITVTYPFGGEKFYVDRSYTLRWSASNLPTNYVDIAYSADNGLTWSEIISSLTNNGSYSWTIPDTASAQCLIRVSARDDASVYDISNSFTIARPWITVTAPLEGEEIAGCSTYQITWDQEGLQNYVRIYYSVDGGTNWLHVANPYVGSNTYYNWTVPSIAEDQFRVKVEDYYNNKVADTSALFSVSQGADFLTLTSPNGGETWPASSSQTITWNTTGTVGNVSLKYSTNNGSSWDWVRNSANSAASNIANTGSYDWLVPSNVVSSNCLLQIYQNSQTCIIDYTDNVFTIDNSPTVTVTYPAGGEKFYVGRSYTIRWSASNLPSNYVDIAYSSDSGSTWSEIVSSRSNNGSYSWTIPDDVSSECLIRVSARDDASIFGISNTFTIAQPYIQITSPNGGEVWPGCTESQIIWEQEGLQNYVKIYYSIDGGFNWISVASPYVGSNTWYNWTVPALGSSTVRVKVEDYYNSAVFATSDADFSVTQGTNYLTLVSPNGHENFSSGTLQEIRWNTTGTIGNISLKYSTDGGASWDWVRDNTNSAASNISNSGSFVWLVPSNLNSTKCLIQIYEHSNTCRIDYSNDFFTINNDPTVTVTAPLPGETWYFGQTKTIRWSASNLASSYVKLEYSLGDDIWHIIQESRSGTSYNWTVPAEASDAAYIRVSSVADPAISDVNDEPFAIKTPVIRVTNPNTGDENWLVGENKNITWNSTGLPGTAQVKIEYSADRGVTWSDIIASVDNSGSYIWTIPNMPTSSQSFVKITSLDYVASKDSNDFAFTITKPIVGVTVPNDGQVWYIGESKSIQWSGMATSENVLIELSTDSGRTYSPIVESTANTGQYFWAIPYNVTPSDECFIKITDVLDPINTDSSDVPFTIAKPIVTLTMPNTNESWYLGETKTISWTNVGMSNSKIRIEYSPDSGSTWSEIALVINDGNYDWSIPSTVVPSEKAFIKISDELDASIKDSNDVAFKMIKPSVRIVNPNGGEVLYLGQTKVITWKKDGSYSPNVRIDYSADSGASWNLITESVVNNESYSWTLASSLVPGNNYLLRIRDSEDPTIEDVSDAVFTVSKPTITVAYPNGGETLYLREAKNIQWQSAALASSRMVKIEFSADSGSSWTSLTEGTANSGSYSWTPTNIQTGNKYLIKISDVLDPTIFDVSNATFNIAAPVITVISPNGNENWYQGQVRNIRWTSGGLPASENMTIEVSSDSGATWTILSSTASNNGSYAWNIPLDQETTGRYYVKVSDTEDLSITDSSDSYFNILKPVLNVITPNGGEIFYTGTSRNLYWNSQGLASSRKVKISLSADNGSTWNEISAETGNTGSFNWTIPYETVPGEYLVKINDILDPTISDISNSTFVISKPTITVVSPNGGEKWYQGQLKTIKWSSKGLTSAALVSVEYSPDNGTSWVEIAGSVSNSGSYNWLIPSDLTAEQVLIKVASVLDNAVSDTGDSWFSIREPRAGDTFETAIAIDSLPYYISDTTGYFSDQYTGIGNQPSGDVFYSFPIPEYSDSISFTVRANFPVILHILAGKDSVVKSSGAAYNYSFGTKGLIPGNTYYLVAEGKNTSSGIFRINLNNHLPPVDLTVYDLVSDKAELGPKDTVGLSWNLSNIGSAPSGINWTERIYMQTPSGENRTLLKQTVFTNTDTLAIGEILARGAQLVMPAQLNIGDQGVFVVEVIPGADIQEAPDGAANNTAVEEATWTIRKLLKVELSSSEITEGSDDEITVELNRTGSLAGSLLVSLNLENPDRFAFPATVIIPAGQAGYSFTISAPDNDLIEGTKTDSLAVSAEGFPQVKAGIKLLDNDKASLTITGLPAEAMEGTSVTFTITTDLAPAQPLEVFLTSDNQTRFPVPASVTIPAGNLSAEVAVNLEQDLTPEVDAIVKVVAGASKHNPANASIHVQDDDIPGLELILETNVVSESGGAFATNGILRRTDTGNPIAFTAKLSADPAGSLIFPSTISLAEGENEKMFNIGVVDNSMVDGQREVILTASVYVGSCGCNAPAASSGSFSAVVTVNDNDGPTLTITASSLTLPEGSANAGYLRISRNTSTEEPLSVALTSSDVNEAVIPASATIPVGQLYVDVPVETINDGVTDGSKQVYFQATATDFSTGSVWVMVTDQNKPDLQIPAVTLSSNNVQAKSIFTYQLSVKNSGFATAPSGVVVRGYLSQDNAIDATDSLISADTVATPIRAGETVQIQNAVKAPNIPGDYKLLYWVNPDLVMTELLTNNNKSQSVNLKINPDYTATAIVDSEYFMKGNPVPVTGSALRFNGEVAAGKPVEVYVITNGLRRTITATTDGSGNYSTEFVPLAKEAGYYTVGASFPGMGATIEQDNFNILGVHVNNGRIPQWRVTLEDTLKGTLSIRNLSNRSLTNFSLAPVELPEGAQVRFDTVAVFPGNTTINLNYTVVDSVLSPGTNFEVATFRAIADEGAVQTTDVFYFCQAPRAHVVADISRLDVSASQSKGERLVEFRLVNKGMGETGDMTVSLPQVNWLSSVTPKVLSSIASGDTAIVILKFLALEEVPFNYPIKGSIGIGAENGNSFTIPFSFEKVSEADGVLKVEVTNQFTYYSEDAPKVQDALVTVKNYFSGEIYAQGYTDPAGIFIAANIPEGKHRISVEKEKHLAYNNTVTINPGDTTEANVFLNYQAITFNWNVEPTAVEDEYDITLEAVFETHVPMPVVTIEMPDVMPELSGSEVYAFNVTLTNHGLITARDVALNLPTEDPEYEFVMNYEPADLLAQQSIQVPVIMRRRQSVAADADGFESPSILAISEFLEIEPEQYSTLSGGGNCKDFAGVVYWYTCNLTTGLWEKGGTLFTYSGRTCTSGGSGGGSLNFGGGGSAGGGGYPSCALCPGTTYGGTGKTPVYESEKKSCIECIDDIISAVTGCVGGPIGDVVGAFNQGRCVGNAATGKGGILECIPLPIPPPISCALDIIKAINTCSNTSVAGASASLNTDEIQEMQKAPLGEVFDEIADNLQIVTDAYQTRENWAREYFGDMVFTDAWIDLGPKLQPYVENLDSIPSAAQAIILTEMEGYEIPQYAIQAFFTRWNTSIHAFNNNILEPNTEYPDIINWTFVKACSDSIVSANDLAISKGYESLDDMFDQSNISLNEALDGQSNAVCASVKVQFSQQLTMTREAFEGTLDIFNGHPTDAMDSITVTIKITDANGVPSNGLFEIQTKSLTNVSDVTGTGMIASQQNGIAKFLFIPEPAAAPQEPQQYKFGGSVRYWDPYAQAMVTIPLASVELTVNPSPNLMLHYFMERNILGDDPFTNPEIEPSIPAELAVMVENHGYGPAVNMTISSAQPEIVENEKGLAINFSLIGSNFQGQPKKLGVTDINFGTIPALQSRIGQWYFTSSLLGKFVSYEANVVHANSFGNPELSLVKGIKLHELTRSIRVYGQSDDGINDFLVNDIFDTQDRPDIIYYSQGKRTAEVHAAESGSFSSPVSPPSYTNTLTVSASDTGWNFIKLNDPGNRKYELVSVTRSDGQLIPLSNAWLTFVTLPVNKPPVYENKFHFVDSFPSLSPVTYTVVWKPKNMNVPEVVSIEGAPEQTSSSQVETLTVKFSKSIDPATFTYEDLNLTFQGGANIINNSVVITQTDTSTFVVDISGLTTGNGFYNFTVQAANVQDIYGISGLSGKNITWSQFLNVPTVQAFLGLPEGNLASSFDTVQVLFNLAVDVSTVTPERFTIWKDGVQQSGTLTIDSIRADKKLVYLSGLGEMLTENGSYELKVDLPNILSEEQVAGMEPQSVVLILDNTGPLVLSLEKSYEGGLDLQHVTFVNIQFNEEVKGFNTASVRLTRNGETLHLAIDQLSYTDLQNWMAGNFGMLTYPDGEYTFTINYGGFTDAIGNSGSGSEQVSWTVDRSAVLTVADLSVSPDLGFSDTDGITSSLSLDVEFSLSDDASYVNVSQIDLSGETVLAHVKDVGAGMVSIPVALLAGGNTGIKVSAVGVNGGEGTAEKTLYIDQTPLSAKWLISAGQTVARQPDTVRISFSSKLLSQEGFLNAITFSRNESPVPKAGLSFEALNDTLFAVYGLRSDGSHPGNYQLSFDMAGFRKYSSGRAGTGKVVASWTVQATNKAPVANAGSDITVVEPGEVTLDASGSSDSDSESVTFEWVAPDGIELNDPFSPMPTFTITSDHKDTTWSFLLIVSDGELFSTDAVNVIISLNGGIAYYRDADGDGYGDPDDVIVADTQPAGYVAQGGDCDDSNSEIHPGAVDILDNIDNDCDGEVDEDVVTNGKAPEAQVLKLKVYPIPADRQFNVILEGAENAEQITVRVYDELGILVDEIKDVSNGQMLILGEKYAKGLYIIEAVQGSLRRTMKVIKL